LESEPAPSEFIDVAESTSSSGESSHISPHTDGLVVWTDLEVDRLKLLITSSRTRLAELQTEYGILRATGDTTQARLFEALQSRYEKRDSLGLRIRYRRRFLDVLLRDGEEEAEAVENEFHQAKESHQQEYEQTAVNHQNKKELTSRSRDA